MSILIFAENRNGKFPRHVPELVTYGRQLADQFRVQAIVLAPGRMDHPELAALGKYGAHRVLSVPDQSLDVMDNRMYSDVILEIAGEEDAEILLFAYSNAGKALAPLVAARLQAAYVSAISGLPAGTDPFVVRKKVFSGKVFTDIFVKTRKKVFTLAPHSLEASEHYDPVTPEIRHVKVHENRNVTERMEIKSQEGKLLLTEADIVISGGRGMQHPDNYKLLEELAALLGGATACTRPVSDEGWRPAEEHAGQTGKIIAPDLYFAFGISGAIQHLAGVSSSKVIAAVNTDPEAPIFEVADYGIVGDALDILPKMIEEIKRRKHV